MELKGTVLNVVDFGAFVDIGLKDSGLVHISQLANRYVKSPHDVVSVGDVVTVWVMGVDQDRKRVSLTMVKPGTERARGAGEPRGGGRRGGPPQGEGGEGRRGSRPRRGDAPRPAEAGPAAAAPEAPRPGTNRIPGPPMRLQQGGGGRGRGGPGGRGPGGRGPGGRGGPGGGRPQSSGGPGSTATPPPRPGPSRILPHRPSPRTPSPAAPPCEPSASSSSSTKPAKKATNRKPLRPRPKPKHSPRHPHPLRPSPPTRLRPRIPDAANPRPTRPSCSSAHPLPGPARQGGISPPRLSRSINDNGSHTDRTRQREKGTGSRPFITLSMFGKSFVGRVPVPFSRTQREREPL